MSQVTQRRYRSRSSNRTRRASGTCGICCEELGGAKTWNCLVCTAVFHERCMPKTKDPRTCQDPDHQDGRGGNCECRIHLPSGCPTCRATMRDAINDFNTPRPAPFGAWCSMCKGQIERGTDVLRCSSPRHHCVAMWHAECRATCHLARNARSNVYLYPGAPAMPRWSTRCPACDRTLYEGLTLRTHSA